MDTPLLDTLFFIPFGLMLYAMVCNALYIAAAAQAAWAAKPGQSLGYLFDLGFGRLRAAERRLTEDGKDKHALVRRRLRAGLRATLIAFAGIAAFIALALALGAPLE